ncbi:MAG: hypothetical protein PHY92_05210 [Alphaproteobacteria bacterium]|nr:hypothetical protein [Alphaproteobacteria bacterium]
MFILQNILPSLVQRTREAALLAESRIYGWVMAFAWAKCFRQLLKHDEEKAHDEMRAVASLAAPKSSLDRRAAAKWPHYWSHVVRENQGRALAVGNDFIAAMPAAAPNLGKLHLGIIKTVLKFIENLAPDELLKIRHGKQNGLYMALTTTGLACIYAPQGSKLKEQAYGLWDKSSDFFAKTYPASVANAANGLAWICGEDEPFGQLVRQKEKSALDLMRQACPATPAPAPKAVQKQTKAKASTKTKTKKKTGRTRLEIREEESLSVGVNAA